MVQSTSRDRRVVVLVALAVALLALGGVGQLTARALTVPEGAAPGSLTTQPCEHDTEAGPLSADCGTLVVPENRGDPLSDLALPVIRIRSVSPDPGTPIFRLGGGPGAANTDFPQADRLVELP